MDRRTAAGVLGVAVDASARRVEKAFRARVRAGHPDRFPPGSEAWEDANDALQRLLAARAVLGRPAPEMPAAASAASAPSWERSSEGFRSARDTDRMARAWGYAWGSFLVVSAVVCVAIGASTSSNDALPLWSPGLAVIGGVALVIGRRADRRLRAEQPGRGQE